MEPVKHFLEQMRLFFFFLMSSFSSIFSFSKEIGGASDDTTNMKMRLVFKLKLRSDFHHLIESYL